jgi:O-6-methylguanine DNA methyltransferase
MSTDLAVIRFPLGSFRASIDDGVVRTATFDETPQPERRDTFGIYDELRAYFTGDVGALDRIAVNPRGTPFQLEVWEQLRRIPVGTTSSYGELAKRVGRPNAQRAVGMANAANPITLIVPCHRVIRTGGALGGYAFGLAYKQWLLAHEAKRHGAEPRSAGRGSRGDTQPLFDVSLFHGNARDDGAADTLEDLVEAVPGDRQAVIA